MPQWLVDTVVNLWHPQSCCNSSENSFSAQMSAQTRPCIQLASQRWAFGADSSVVAHAPLLAAANSQCFCRLSLHLFLLWKVCTCPAAASPPRIHTCLLPCHFLVLSRSFTLMPSCQLGTSLILATLPGWHAAPTRAPRPALITAFRRFRCRCFATSDLSEGFICRWWWKEQPSFFDFPASRRRLRERDEMRFDTTWRSRWCDYPQFTVQGCSFIQTDSLVVVPQFICLFQQEGAAVYHGMITHLASPAISETDALDVAVDLPLWPCTRCLSHRQSCQIPAAALWLIGTASPWGGCASAAAMYCRFGAAIFKASIIASYSIRSLSAAASDFPTICWMMRSRRVAPEERWNPIFAALRCFSPTTRHCRLSLTRHRDC